MSEMQRYNYRCANTSTSERARRENPEMVRSAFRADQEFADAHSRAMSVNGFTRHEHYNPLTGRSTYYYARGSHQVPTVMNQPAPPALPQDAWTERLVDKDQEEDSPGASSGNEVQEDLV